MLVQPARARPSRRAAATTSKASTRAPERINPLFAATNPTDADLASLVFSGLVRLGPDGTPQPDLAERWEITGNGQSYVFHLRHGVAWQDGEPFDADDVVFTFKAIADPGVQGRSGAGAAHAGRRRRRRAIRYTVEFRLEQAYAPFLAYLTVGILPQHLLEGLDANELFNAEFNAHPVGTGPYRVQHAHRPRRRARRQPDVLPRPAADLDARVPHLRRRRRARRGAPRSATIDGALLGPDAPAADLDFLRRGHALHAARRSSATSYNIIYLDTRSPIFGETTVRQALWQAHQSRTA